MMMVIVVMTVTRPMAMIVVAVRVVMMSCVVRRIACANALDVMVVAFLNHTNFVFKAQHLITIFAAHAVHDIVAC